MAASAHFNVNCIEQMMSAAPTAFDWLRFDSNDNCNLHCLYCHNSRSQDRMDVDTFERFLTNNVVSIENFQFGCRMEPTLDSRLVDFMELLAGSDQRPTSSIALQTNGTRLHRHDHDRLVNAGLTDLQLSIDTIDEQVFAELRGGADVEKILSNTTQFAADQPGVRIKFVVTVSTLNVAHIEELVEFGIGIGAASFIIREMFHMPGAAHVDDEKMASIVLSVGEFTRMTDQLQQRFDGKAILNCINTDGLLSYNKSVQKVSYQPVTLQ